MDLWALSDLSTPWCVHIVATLRIADHIVAGNTEIDKLAGAAGADPQVLIDPADWESVRTVVDIGGGRGALLAEVLRARPEIRGTLVDLPPTVARSGELFRAAGVADRVTAVGQSFFDPLPGGGDLYLLKSILSDWPDREAQMILRHCAEAARPSGRVVILNGVEPDGNPSPELLMMVLVGGKNRTLAEFRALAGEAGLEVRATAPALGQIRGRMRSPLKFYCFGAFLTRSPTFTASVPLYAAIDEMSLTVVTSASPSSTSSRRSTFPLTGSRISLPAR
jgi:hypothetical protein